MNQRCRVLVGHSIEVGSESSIVNARCRPKRLHNFFGSNELATTQWDQLPYGNTVAVTRNTWPLSSSRMIFPLSLRNSRWLISWTQRV